jgi:hypothetical protein
VRSRYRAALSTYLRWPLILVAFFEAMIALMAVFWLASGPPSRITFEGVVAFALCLVYLGIVVAEHLKEVLATPRSRVTPGLHTTHLLVAGAMTAVVGVGLPCLIAGFTVGLGERGLAVVAVTLAALTVPAMLSQCPRPGLLVWCFWLLFPLDRLLFDQWAYPAGVPVSLPSSIALLAAGLASLFALAIHFQQLREETPGYARRGLLRPLWGPASAISRSRDEQGRQLPSFRVSVPRNLRALGGKSPGVGENLLRRALHWHAGSGVGWNMLLQGMFLAPIVLAPLMVSFLDTRSLTRALGNISDVFCLIAPLVGLYPAFSMGLQPAVRARVAGEFLRPFSRTQHVQAVGLVLTVFLASESLAFMLFPVAALWLVASKADWSQQALWPLAAGLSAIPLFLGVGLANLRESEVFWAILGSWIVYPLFLWLAASCEGKGEGWPLFGLCALMAAIGLATMRGAYRSWLKRDVA